MTYKNQFKHHRLTTKGFKSISTTQQVFENFWIKLSKVDCSEYEKQMALDKLKEASSWFTRGLALKHVDNSDDKGDLKE